MAANTFILDDGTKEIQLVNPFGREIAKLHIRTADIAIVDRYKRLQEALPAIIAPLNEISLNADGSAEEDADWNKLKGVQNKLAMEIDKLFDMDGEAKQIFANRSMFSSVGGHFFVENLLNLIGEIITETVEEEVKLTQARTNKYLKDIEDDRPTTANA